MDVRTHAKQITAEVDGPSFLILHPGSDESDPGDFIARALPDGPERDSDTTLALQIDYPAACNAAETLILHESVLPTIWPAVAKALLAADVTLLCDPPSLDVLQGSISASPNVQPAPPDAYTTEHLSLTLSVLTVPSLAAAMAHINAHSSHHTECIVAEDAHAASVFCRGVDSAGTFVNASTRFADGFRYGFGTEVGISTGRIHARGPVGLEGLVTYKYMLRSTGGEGHVVGEFGAGEGKKRFKHKRIEASAVPF